jgi:hypothetical protein
MEEIFDTPAAINERNFRALIRADSFLAKGESYRMDVHKESRLKHQSCRYCYYIRGDRIVGQAFTTYKCGICKQDNSWHNTGIPVLCPECAKKNNLCISCGADIELKDR